MSINQFGCMPSSGVSDGVQSLIASKYPGTIFCAVETSGDGATNFYSRVQMYMFKARIAAAKELARVYEECGVTEAEVRAFLEANPKYASPLHHSPHRVAGSAANLVYEVTPLIKQSALTRAKNRAIATATTLKDAALATPAAARKAFDFVRSPDTHERLAQDVALGRELLGGKAKTHLMPLLQKLLGKAVFENNAEIATATAHYESEAIAAE